MYIKRCLYGFAGGVLLGLSSLAYAQWGWTEADGRKVYSDRPPPNDVPQSRIFKKPAEGARSRALAAETPAAKSEEVAKPAVPDAATKELDAKKKQAEAQEAAKKKELEDKIAQQKATNCQQAKQAKANLDSGMRIARVNLKTGEREIMEDNERAAETKRIQEHINSNCK